MKAAEFADAQRFLLAHAARLRAYLHMMLGNLHDAEDVLQETFASFLEKGPAPSEHASRWLFTVSRNHALTLRRTQLRRIDREQAAATLAASSSDAAGADPAAIANDRDAIDHLGKCLARLDEECADRVPAVCGGAIAFRDRRASARAEIDRRVAMPAGAGGAQSPFSWGCGMTADPRETQAAKCHTEGQAATDPATTPAFEQMSHTIDTLQAWKRSHESLPCRRSRRRCRPLGMRIFAMAAAAMLIGCVSIAIWGIVTSTQVVITTPPRPPGPPSPWNNPAAHAPLPDQSVRVAFSTSDDSGKGRFGAPPDSTGAPRAVWRASGGSGPGRRRSSGPFAGA